MIPMSESFEVLMLFYYDNDYQNQYCGAYVPVNLHRHPKSLSMPPGHDLDRRMQVYTHEGWVCRSHARNDINYANMAALGQLHLQLWLPHARVSILTPSSLTDGDFEVCLFGDLFRVSSSAELNALLVTEAAVAPPCPGLIHYLQTWLVWAPSLCASVR